MGKRPEQTPNQSRYIHVCVMMTNKHTNDAQHHMSLGTCKLKQQEDSIQHLLGENPKH